MTGKGRNPLSRGTNWYSIVLMIVLMLERLAIAFKGGKQGGEPAERGSASSSANRRRV
jgi:hypothetical protein